MRKKTIILGVAGTALALQPALNRWCRNWGAEENEIEGPMPGDGLIPEPGVTTTRAVSIDAPASAVWPWLVQMGSGRGGAYTYDWIENLFGLDMHSADEILPAFQNLKVDDVLPLGPSGPPMRVAVLEPERALVFRSEDGNWVWSFLLREKDGVTRLISRNRIDVCGAAKVFYDVVMTPASLFMESRMLHGIRDRAELKHR
ncbi:SRPBCC family protein [Herbidospora sp. NEAU-GS84]|uniref:SRPBCC family protein n=1 Tax=Herbidospora solisilvae TaxID=2696284 RepID=A0A7C9N433_9ACTN|nr:SRPBCC family protein [Herbidospora solisilvae]NAS25990.1 SRPBCC family protein [Herbidospora solisilvae]